MLSDDWTAWVRENLERGCTPDSLVRAMLAEHIDGDEVALAVANALAGIDGARSATGPCWPDRFALRLANHATVGDRQVSVVARLERPAAVLLDNVLSHQECDYLIALSTQQMRPSTVVSPDSGELATIEARSSEGAWFTRGHDETIAAIESRLAALMQVPVDHGEGLQVLHYRAGGEYRPHYDYFPPEQPGSVPHLARGGQRTASLIMYLNSPDAGGETIFPLAGASFVPRRGSALYFAYCDGRGGLDSSSLHGGAPVAAGEKWIATKWVRQQPYR
ncbi:2OG-Fe(II) oxygenase [Lysobacter sp. S4-A87]|uniref:2OG-Fe(II) oxygenase n=1 Tax=Lysobacter sp. S4-A87 TaxID=2925843 RepID=UPI001F52F706|nr:2OG-Fe(II) oxygenase [Lysobacter sp. S4-A87]UNK49985.1 2OG-Fe(II) oxygenase [Lysobacter sp. S4-A87]